MYNFFQFTEQSVQRNQILKSLELNQPFLLLNFSSFIKSKIFIDIGANIGAYSLFFSLLKTNNKIYSFEACSYTYNELIKNIALNGLQEKIFPFNQAVSSESGVVEFGIANNDLSGINAILDTTIHSKNKYITREKKESINIDSLKIRNEIISIKIDVEGHEFKVLQGMVDTLTENECVLQIESYLEDELINNDIFLKNLFYERILRCGPDSYYTNNQNLRDCHQVKECVESSFRDLIKYSSAFNKNMSLSFMEDVK